MSLNKEVSSAPGTRFIWGVEDDQKPSHTIQCVAAAAIIFP